MKIKLYPQWTLLPFVLITPFPKRVYIAHKTLRDHPDRVHRSSWLKIAGHTLVSVAAGSRLGATTPQCMGVVIDDLEEIDYDGLADKAADQGSFDYIPSWSPKPESVSLASSMDQYQLYLPLDPDDHRFFFHDPENGHCWRVTVTAESFDELLSLPSIADIFEWIPVPLWDQLHIDIPLAYSYLEHR